MMYPYMSLADGTEIMHSQLTEKGEVHIHFERAHESGFDSVRCTLPSYSWTVWEGEFTPEEMEFYAEFVHKNAHLLYKYAKS